MGFVAPSCEASGTGHHQKPAGLEIPLTSSTMAVCAKNEITREATRGRVMGKIHSQSDCTVDLLHFDAMNVMEAVSCCFIVVVFYGEAILREDFMLSCCGNCIS